ncbi:MAG: hypothetical protein JWO94_3830, partial [Verrucomicrobiaceae bacterium]|nr:hypothetical protein [Verrucomicrobiaceae bacterium]
MMRLPLLTCCLLAFWSGSHAADTDQGITWLVNYEGAALPGAAWSAGGQVNAKVEAGGLHLIDDSPTGFGCYRAAWKAGAGQEIIVEARVKVGSETGSVKGKPATSLWPWRDGVPVGLLISDGHHQDGLVLFPAQATSFTDRFIPMDTTSHFHTYRLIIHGTDMTMSVDGVEKVHGQHAFWKEAESATPFIQFGSNARIATGDAFWASVKLGVRKPSGPVIADPLNVTLGKAWEIPREDVKQTRPYLYDMGKGLLLMSVAQGPDAFYEPYGLLKSLDEGRTWTPIP